LSRSFMKSRFRASCSSYIPSATRMIACLYRCYS
jgi:hypothetical protein